MTDQTYPGNGAGKLSGSDDHANGLSALVVEDDEDMRRLIEKVLLGARASGHNLRGCRSRVGGISTRPVSSGVS